MRAPSAPLCLHGAEHSEPKLQQASLPIDLLGACKHHGPPSAPPHLSSSARSSSTRPTMSPAMAASTLRTREGQSGAPTGRGSSLPAAGHQLQGHCTGEDARGRHGWAIVAGVSTHRTRTHQSSSSDSAEASAKMVRPIKAPRENHHALRYIATRSSGVSTKSDAGTSHNCKTSTIAAVDAAVASLTCLHGSQQGAAPQCQDLPMAQESMSSGWRASWAGAARSQRWHPYLAPTRAAAWPDRGRILAHSAAAPESTSAGHRAGLVVAVHPVMPLPRPHCLMVSVPAS